jgi:hypothetical protein
MGYPHYSNDCGEFHDLVRDFGGASIIGPLVGSLAREEAHRAHRPTIVCLCGSSRFYDEFQQANYELTMAGEIVLSIGFYPHAKAEHGHGEGVGHDSAEKVALDELHKRKIDLADYVYVLNVGDYIGDSTRSEIEYAKSRHRSVTYLEEHHEPAHRAEVA